MSVSKFLKAVSGKKITEAINSIIDALPTKVSDLQNDAGYTTNTGTVTKVNNTPPDNNGNVSITIPTVDQTYNASSSNAQSGVAINGAKFIQNTATGSNGLTVGGTASTTGGSTNVGMSSIASKSYSTAIGYNSQAKGNYSTTVGWNAMATKQNAIQIGYGTNTTENSLSVGFYNQNNYQLLDGATGLIPDARISSNIARTSAIPTVPTTLSSFTDDLGSSPTHTHSQYLTSVTSHNQASSTINALTSYSKSVSGGTGALSTSDTLNKALAKLENALDGKQASGSYAASSHTHTKSNITDMPTKLSQFTDDLGTSPTHTHSQYLTSHQSLSGYVPTSRTINSKALTSNISLTASDVGAQATLVSGTNIKTINGNSILGSGDLTISGGGTAITITYDV